MTRNLRIEAVPGDGPALDDFVGLFEAYRAHYGGHPDPVGAREWLRARLSDGRLHGFVAYADGEPAGMAVVAPSPMSQRLGTAWSIRDVYVDTAHRRAGVARALLDAVTSAARSAGVLRAFLQTEVDNSAARALYTSYGFEPVEGYLTLTLELR